MRPFGRKFRPFDRISYRLAATAWLKEEKSKKCMLGVVSEVFRRVATLWAKISSVWPYHAPLSRCSVKFRQKVLYIRLELCISQIFAYHRLAYRRNRLHEWNLIAPTVSLLKAYFYGILIHTDSAAGLGRCTQARRSVTVFREISRSLLRETWSGVHLPSVGVPVHDKHNSQP